MHWTCLLAVHFTLADAALEISRPRRARWREADSSLTSEAQLSLSETDRQTDRQTGIAFPNSASSRNPLNRAIALFNSFIPRGRINSAADYLEHRT